MRMYRAALLLLLATLAASSALAATISGAVYDDPPALAMHERFVPLAGVTVKLFRDSDATLVTSTRTGAGGQYSFTVGEGGTYWVAVDSRTIHSEGALPGARIWAEQTYGPAGASCIQLSGTGIERSTPGPCFGGRTTGSDDASMLSRSEHVARVIVGDSGALDFAFSFNAVTVIGDSPSDEQPIQGSLRQFLQNANAIRGANAMRFVPLVKSLAVESPTQLGMPSQWWTIAPRRPLPVLRDPGTTLEGNAYSLLSPTLQLDVNPRHIGESLTGSTEADQKRQQMPELELVTSGDDGIVCEGQCSIRHLCVRGSATSIVLRADAYLEHVIVGARADVAPSGKFGATGIQIERGTAEAHQIYVADQRGSGILVAGPEGKLLGDRVQVVRCGDVESGAGIALLSSDSVVRGSMLAQNLGAAIILGLPNGSVPVHRNIIESSILSSNAYGIVISPGATDNRIADNTILWNRYGGIVVAPFTAAAAAPVRNRISSNRFNENGGRPIALDPKLEVNRSMPESSSCMRQDGAANTGVAPPRITSIEVQKQEGNADMIVVSGQGCPGTTVEIYQSYATSQLRDNTREVRLLHGDAGLDADPNARKSAEERKRRKRAANWLPETRTQEDEGYVASIGEFNPVTSGPVAADGRFSFTVPVVRPKKERFKGRDDEDNAFEISFRSIFTNTDPLDTAFAALAIDPEGNTSELGMRHLVKRVDR
ncbi:MAG: putative internalin [Acidobacteria bacterium]|nr:putative internalin [Acidobacteriota bacterium]